MEKIKYIVKGLGAILFGAGAVVALMYGVVKGIQQFGLQSDHVTGALVICIVIGMIVFWLSEDYDIKKIRNKR